MTGHQETPVPTCQCAQVRRHLARHRRGWAGLDKVSGRSENRSRAPSAVPGKEEARPGGHRDCVGAQEQGHQASPLQPWQGHLPVVARQSQSGASGKGSGLALTGAATRQGLRRISPESQDYKEKGQNWETHCLTSSLIKPQQSRQYAVGLKVDIA